MPEAIFFEMFVFLIEARCEWEKNPTDPYYRYEEYNPAILELIAFRKSVGDGDTIGESWLDTNAVFFNKLAGGFDVDEDEDEDVIMDDPNVDETDMSANIREYTHIKN